MRARGLARGGSLHNAVVLDDTGILSGPLRFRDEFVRHKILDLIGDLSLLGRPLSGHVYARKAGHALHIEFARALDAALRQPARQTRADFGPRAAPAGPAVVRSPPRSAAGPKRRSRHSPPPSYNRSMVRWTLIGVFLAVFASAASLAAAEAVRPRLSPLVAEVRGTEVFAEVSARRSPEPGARHAHPGGPRNRHSIRDPPLPAQRALVLGLPARNPPIPASP